MAQTITAWRIAQSRYLDGAGPGGGAFSGEGARRFGGRWNSRGTAVAYTAGSQSLALLEILVHLDTAHLLRRYALVPIRFEERHVTTLDPGDLPDDWRRHPTPTSTQTLGDRWVREGTSAVLRVPSVIVPAEFNYVVHAHHPDLAVLDIGAPRPLDVDERLFGVVG